MALLKTTVEVHGLPILIDQTTEGVWLQAALPGGDPDDDTQAIAAVKLDYFEGKLRVLVFDKEYPVGGDPAHNILLWENPAGHQEDDE